MATTRSYLFVGPAMIVLAALACTLPARSPATAPTPRVTQDQRANFANYQTLGVFLENQANRRLPTGLMRELEDEFMRIILERGYTLAARSDMDRVLRELRIQSSSITEEAAARMGKMLNIPGMLIITITAIDVGERARPFLAETARTYFRTNVAVSARLVDSERAQVLWISSYGTAYDHDSGDGARDIAIGPALQHVARVVASGLPARTPG